MEELLAKYQIKDSVIAVGVSGGADSLALVLQAAEELAVFGRKIVALTVDHRLRPTSRMEAEYVAGLMEKYGIEHHILSWNTAKPKTGIEEAARQARYSLIRSWCNKNGVRVLMTAHHAKDQAETFLMRLQRGSGLEGLCGIREYSVRDGLIILRPLLHVFPEDFRLYLQKRGIVWVEDESNADTSLLRGRLRQFLPELADKTGINVEKICGAVQALQSAEDFIEQTADEATDPDVSEKDKKKLSETFNMIKVRIEQFKLLWETVKRFFTKFFKRIKITNLMIDFVISGEDACEAAVNYGKVSTAVYNGIALLKLLFRVSVKTVDIGCEFESGKSSYDCTANVTLGLGTAVGLLLGALFGYLKNKEKIDELGASLNSSDSDKNMKT